MKARQFLAIIALFACGCSKQQPADGQPKERVLEHSKDASVVTNATPIIIVSDLTPDPYTHPTTHPKSRYEELGLEGGHGDGFAEVKFVGKVVYVAEDGHIQPVANVKFVRLKETLPSGEMDKDVLPFTTDANGDFRTELNIFAAYAKRKGGAPYDSVMYQSGIAALEVESEGFTTQPIAVKFEQPSTLIVLKRMQ